MGSARAFSEAGSSIFIQYFYDTEYSTSYYQETYADMFHHQLYHLRIMALARNKVTLSADKGSCYTPKMGRQNPSQAYIYVSRKDTDYKESGCDVPLDIPV